MKVIVVDLCINCPYILESEDPDQRVACEKYDIVFDDTGFDAYEGIHPECELTNLT